MPIHWRMKEWLALNRDVHNAAQFQRLLSQKGVSLSFPTASSLYQHPPTHMNLVRMDQICSALGCSLNDFCQVVPENESPTPVEVTSPVDTADYSLGVLALSEGRIADSARHLKQHLTSNPYDIRALKMLAECQTELGDNRAAEATCNRVLMLDPSDTRILHLRGRLLLRNRRLAAAIKSLERVLEIEPRYSAARLDLAYAYAKASRHDEALAQTEKVTMADPANWPAHHLHVIALKRAGKNSAAAAHLGRLKLAMPDLHEKIIRASDRLDAVFA